MLQTAVKEGEDLSDYYAATFYSVSQALRFEKMLQAKGIAVKIIPVPRAISSSCGVAARFAPPEYAAVKELLGEDSVEGIYHLSTDGGKMHAEKVWP